MSWELSLGLYPGIVVGARSYVQNKITEHVLYIPFIELCLTIHNE